MANTRLSRADHPLLHAGKHDLEHNDIRWKRYTQNHSRLSCILLVALQEFDRDALRSADEANAHARPNSDRLFRELHTLGLDLGGHCIDVLHGQPEMIQPLVRCQRRGVDAVARRDRRDEHVGAAELDIDSPGAADDHAAENIFKPGGSRLRIGTAQVNMVPGDYRHRRSPLGFLAGRLPATRARFAFSVTRGAGAVNLAAAFPHGHARGPRAGPPLPSNIVASGMQPFPVLSIDGTAAEPRNRQSRSEPCGVTPARLCYRAVQQAIWVSLRWHDDGYRALSHRIDGARR